MESVNNYLKKYFHDSFNDMHPDLKLKQFCQLFHDFELKVVYYQNDIEELKAKHKKELNELETYIQLVKNLTEEREKITIEYQEENNNLRKQIEDLRFLVNQNDVTGDQSISSSKQQAIIDLLEKSGLDNLITKSNYEKLVILINDRANNNKLKTTTINNYDQIDKNNEPQENSIEKISDEIKLNMQRIEELENEIETLKSANKKLSREIDSYKQCSSMSGSLNALDDIHHYNNTTSSSYNKNGGSNADITDMNKLKSKLNDYEIKMRKLQEDNFGFKSEIDKLYDDIGQFEKEIQILRDENLHLKDDNENLLDEIDWIKSTKIPPPQASLPTGVMSSNGAASSGDDHIKNENVELKVENDRLKQEIDALNNELDELIYYKSNFERLNLDYEKLKQKSVENLLTSAASSTLTLNKHGGSQSHLVGAGTSSGENKNLHLEIEWIRRENEKLLFENENLQAKVSDQKISIEKLHKDMQIKDERMNKFIEQVEKNKLENNQEESIKLQKEITKLESALNDEKRNYNYIKDQNESKQKELNDMNEHLWNNFNKIQHNYDEAIEIIKSKEADIETLLSEKAALEKSIKFNEQTINQNENKINDLLNELNIKENKIRIIEFDINKLKIDLNLLSEEKTNEKTTFELNINDLKQLTKNLQANVNSKDTEISSLIKDKELLIGQHESSHKKLLQDFMELQHKHSGLNEQLGKVFKENAEMITFLKEKEQLVRKLEADLSHINHQYEEENREKLDALDRIKNLEQVVDKNWEKISGLSEKLQKTDTEKSKLEIKAKDMTSLEDQYRQLCTELNEKRDTISNVLEKNGKLELRLIDAERQLKELQQRLFNADNTITDLNSMKADMHLKHEEYIKYKHEYESEKYKREKSEHKLNDMKEEYKKQKQKLKKTLTENNQLQHEIIDAKNQLHGIRSKFDTIADRSNTELEKLNTLNDELNEVRKKLEHAELKCVSYSQKFELLLKKYATRKQKCKNKIERLWEYFQREKAKYKELLSNAQNDLTNTKTTLEKETEFKTKQESSYQQIIEEKRNLLASMVDKDAKMRDMKRQNFLLSSKIKLLEEEMENLHEKIDHTLKERNKLRKEVNLSMNHISEQILNSRSGSPTISLSGSNPHHLSSYGNNSVNSFGHIGSNGLTGSLGNLNMISTAPNFIEPFKTSSISSNFYSNPGFTNEWHKFKLNDPVIRGGFSPSNNNSMNNNSNLPQQHSQTNGLITNAFDLSITSFLAGTSVNNDFNSTNTTPRSFI